MKDSPFLIIAVPRILSAYAMLIFAAAWVGFVIALIVNPAWLDMLWKWVQLLPLFLQAVFWIVFLPVMVGLWIWQSALSLPLTILAAAGLVGWTSLAVTSFLKTFFGPDLPSK
ncbi:MAG: hypothetical protein CL609_08095 [Anaerolineaceae bacterium]|nr:hypothetical protein [Anaerolineaceae bacterium]